jgi:hypothetical protein
MESESASEMLEPSLPGQVGIFKKFVNSSVYEQHFGPLEHLTQNTLNGRVTLQLLRVSVSKYYVPLPIESESMSKMLETLV